MGQRNRMKVFWECLLHGVIWGIRKERNLRLFVDHSKPNSEVIDLILREVGGWLSMHKDFIGFSQLLFS